jgi:hypothetical protein
MVNEQIFVIACNIAGIITKRRSQATYARSGKHAVLWGKTALTTDTSIADHDTDCIPSDPRMKLLNPSAVSRQVQRLACYNTSRRYSRGMQAHGVVRTLMALLPEVLRVAVTLFPGFTILNVYGPVQAFAR